MSPLFQSMTPADLAAIVSILVLLAAAIGGYMSLKNTVEDTKQNVKDTKQALEHTSEQLTSMREDLATVKTTVTGIPEMNRQVSDLRADMKGVQASLDLLIKFFAKDKAAGR